MMSLFDEEQIMKSYIKSERYDVVKEKALLMLQSRKITVDEIGKFFPELIESDIKELEAEVMQLA